MGDKDKQHHRGPGSFCVPRAALEALLDAKASAYEICAYLVLAKFTDETGKFSTAAISAVNRYTGANKVKGGPIDRAITRLKTIRAKGRRQVPKKRGGGMEWQELDLGPILWDRRTWVEHGGEEPKDGPHERAKVLHVLSDFGEDLADRVWFGNGLVDGFAGFAQPLKALKDAGDVAARLLLTMYMANDMELWGGVRPIGDGAGPWVHYEPVGDGEINLWDGVRLIRSKRAGEVGPGDTYQRTWSPSGKVSSWWKAHADASGPVWRALEALQSSGLIYEVVMVLNRNPNPAEFGGGGKYSDIPPDAEPYYELDTRSRHGYKPEGEEGIGAATARTAGDLGYPVTLEGGQFDGTYAAIVPSGYGAMIAGVYRLRFRPSNPKNAGVASAWQRIGQGNREGFELVQSIRASRKLEPLTPPWEAASKAKDRKVASTAESEQS